MKIIMCLVAGCLLFLMGGLQEALAQEGYTFFTSSGGTRICIGTWVPPRGAGFSGSCEGTVMDLSQLTALSTRQSVDRLDQLLVALNSIDQKMTTNIDQVNQLISETRNTQNSIDAQVRQTNQILQDNIARRFDALPGEILENEAFREELKRLKEDILAEVDKAYQPRPPSSIPLK
jgi:hypothetical protein